MVAEVGVKMVVDVVIVIVVVGPVVVIIEETFFQMYRYCSYDNFTQSLCNKFVAQACYIVCVYVMPVDCWLCVRAYTPHTSMWFFSGSQMEPQRKFMQARTLLLPVLLFLLSAVPPLQAESTTTSLETTTTVTYESTTWTTEEETTDIETSSAPVSDVTVTTVTATGTSASLQIMSE